MSVAVCGWNAFRATDAAKRVEGVACLIGGGIGYGLRGFGWFLRIPEVDEPWPAVEILGKAILLALATFQVVSNATWG